MLSLRAHSIISGCLFAALILVAIGGAVLQATEVIPQRDEPWLPAIALVFGLFLAFGFSLVPVMVMLVLGFHKKVGQADAQPIKGLIAARNVIVWTMWALMAAGLVVALPAMMRDGFFS